MRQVGPSPDDATHTSDTLGTPTAGQGAATPSTGVSLPHQRYRILGEHGRGGLGRVSRAHDCELGRDIAIKELLSRGHVREMRFLREALITARLEHPGIVPVYEAGRWADGTPYYAMKLVAGRSLRELLADRATIEERIKLLHHVIAVTDAIAYAHDRNIIHRDLKPANVIVGDFGETIVIDWGLAKDLTVAEDVPIDSGPFRNRGEEGLTSTGSVLGTPAYMPPEQLRGETVDRRADVHAIGAMLWELCTSQRLPPDYSGQRGTVLRRVGIDNDLASIIKKALDPSPERRYPHAGALAADLKAFKAGARISARRYSLFAMLAHWTKRHRALAVSVLAGIAVLSAGLVMHVLRISAERDRATAANDALLLEKAELLLRTDPTAAFEALMEYAGPASPRVELLRSEALGLGVARMRAMPHTQTVGFVQTVGDRSLVTLGDGHVTKSTLDGTSRSIADTDPRRYVFDYAPARSLLAFACPATRICLLDISSERPLPPPLTIARTNPAKLALSHSGRLLAAMSDRGKITLWQVGDSGPPVMRLQASVDRGRSLAFANENILVAHSGDRMLLFHLDALGQALSPASEIATPEISDFSASAELHVIALGSTTGHLTLVDSRSSQIVGHSMICKGAVNRVVALPTRGAIAYTCQDGDVGTWSITSNESGILAHLDGGTSTLAASENGSYLVAGGNSGGVIVHDFRTGHTGSYMGHASRILAVSPPTVEFAYATSIDSHGELRLWNVPDPGIATLITATTRLFESAQLESNGTTFAVGNSELVSWRMRDGTAGQTAGHLPAHSRLAVSSTLPEAVMYGEDDELELWTFAGEPTRRTLRTGHGGPRNITYRYRSAAFIVGCSDGTLLEWSDSTAASRVLGVIDEPIAFIRRLRTSDAVVAGAASGRLWLVDSKGKKHIGWEPNATTSVVVSPDARWLATASPQGIVHLYNLSTLAILTIHSPHKSNEWLWFSPDSGKLAVVTSKTISLIDMPTAAEDSPPPDDRRWSWSVVDLAVRHVYFSSDNEWLAATGDHGAVWFNHRGDRRWIHRSLGANRITMGSFSGDNSQFLAHDAGGRVLSIDLRVISR